MTTLKYYIEYTLTLALLLVLYATIVTLLGLYKVRELWTGIPYSDRRGK